MAGTMMINRARRLPLTRGDEAHGGLEGGMDAPWGVAAGLARGRFEGASFVDPDRWQGVGHQPISMDLMQDLRTLRQRALHAYWNDPLLQGIVETHVSDIVGPRGPALRFTGDPKMPGSEAYAERLEAVFRQWFELPDYAQELDGVEMLRLHVTQCWHSGEALVQKVMDRRWSGRIKVRAHTLDPWRLDTPAGMMDSRDLTMGIRTDSRGVRELYYIGEPDDWGGESFTRYAEVNAEDIIHLYRKREASQRRGVPWMTPALNTGIDLKHYNEEVMQAARLAAWMSIIMVSDNPAVKAYNGPREYSVPLGRMRMHYGVPGFKPHVINPGQPGATYKEFIRERQRELARMVCMPLMAVRLDASEHNMSSARYDKKVYDRANESIQYWLERRELLAWIQTVEMEARFEGLLPFERPAGVRIGFVWPKSPDPDPKKEMDADKGYFSLGVRPPSKIAGDQGLDLDDLLRSWRRDAQAFAEAGLPELAEMVKAHAGMPSPLPPAESEGAEGGNGAQSNDDGDDAEGSARIYELEASYAG